MSPITLLSPTFLLGALGATLIVAGVSGYEGYHISSLKWQHRIDSLYKQAELVAQAEQDRAFEASAAYEKGRAQGRIRYQTIHDHTEQVIHDNVVFYSGECLDADGLRSVNAALAGPQADTAEPTAAVPSAPSTDGR